MPSRLPDHHADDAVRVHLRIDGERSGVIEIDVRADTPDAGAYLEYRQVSYEEIGGEAFNAARQRSRHPCTPTFTRELRRLLRNLPPPTPSPPPPLDGTEITLTFGSGPTAVEYTWGNELPAEWNGLRSIARLLLDATGIEGRGYLCDPGVP